jgi:uncharacterized protein YciI
MSAEGAKVRYVIVHLPGPRWRAGVAFQEQPGVQEHVEHYRKLQASGKLEKGGPFVEGAMGGMMIPVADMGREELRRFAAQDPAVKAGLLNFELWGWYVAMERP